MIRSIDHDAVLTLWSNDYTSEAIARRLGLGGSEQARTIIRRARLRGDPRAVERPPGRSPPNMVGVLPRPIAELARKLAFDRNLSLSDFCLRILEVTIRDGIVGAVLDDAPAKVLQDTFGGNPDSKKHLSLLPSVQH